MNENQDARFLSGRAEIIDELESSIPRWLCDRTAAMWYPRYVHFLRVNHRHKLLPLLKHRERLLASQLHQSDLSIRRALLSGPCNLCRRQQHNCPVHEYQAAKGR